MHDDRSVMERWFGDSWQTTLAGWGGAGLGILLVVLGRLLDVADLVVTGVSLIGISVVAVGQLARSKGASAAAKVERVAQHLSNEIQIQEVKNKLENIPDTIQKTVVPLATEVAKDVARTELQR